MARLDKSSAGQPEDHMEQLEAGDSVSLKLSSQFSVFWASGLLAQDRVCLLPCREGLCSTSHTPSLGPTCVITHTLLQAIGEPFCRLVL